MNIDGRHVAQTGETGAGAIIILDRAEANETQARANAVFRS
jgi:hypothetical protein